MTEPNEAKGGASFEEALTRNVQTLRARLVTGALVALVVLAALAVGLLWRQYEDAKRDAARELRARAILAATVFDTYFAGQLATLSAIAASPTVVAGDAKAMTGYFAGFRPGKGSTSPPASGGSISRDGSGRPATRTAQSKRASQAGRTSSA